MPDFDLIVAGAGPAGLCAAIAAARAGLRVLLIERSGQLGGSNTQSLVCPLMGFHAGRTQVIRGLAQEIIDRLYARGGTLGHIPDPLGVASTITPIEPELLELVYFELLRELPGITLLLHTFVSSVQRESDRIVSISAVGKSGTMCFQAPLIIDATGDADLAAMSGVPFTEGRASDGLSQPMTMVIRIGGIDFNRVRAAMRAAPEQFVLADVTCMTGDAYVAVSGYFDAVAAAREKGSLTFPRDRVLLFQGVREGEAFVNMSRVILKHATDAFELSQAEMEGRRQIDEILAFLRHNIDGFEHAVLIESGAAIGVRESRHIAGLYTLTARDVLSGSAFEDAVAVGAFPIDIHDPGGQALEWVKTEMTCYDVPYRVMIPQGLCNLLVTGRPVSATHEAAASVRITPTVMALGQAAGIAAALAGSAGFPGVSPKRLTDEILAAGGIPGQACLHS